MNYTGWQKRSIILTSAWLFFCAEVSMLEPVEWQGQHDFGFILCRGMHDWASRTARIIYCFLNYVYKGTVKNLQWSGMWCKNKVYSLSHVSVSLPSYRVPSRTINCRKPKITPLKRKSIFPTSVFVFYLSVGSAFSVEQSDILITYGPGVIQARKGHNWLDISKETSTHHTPYNPSRPFILLMAEISYQSRVF